MKKVGIALLCMGIALLLVSVIVSSAVTHHEDMQAAADFLGAEITPDGVQSLMEVLDMFGEDLLDPTARLGLQLYARSPAMNLLGALGIGGGVVLLLGSKFCGSRG